MAEKRYDWFNYLSVWRKKQKHLCTVAVWRSKVMIDRVCLSSLQKNKHFYMRRNVCSPQSPPPPINPNPPNKKKLTPSDLLSIKAGTLVRATADITTAT